MGFYLSFSTNFIIQLKYLYYNILAFFFLNDSVCWKKKLGLGRVPCGSVVRTQQFHSHGPGLIPGQGTEILSAMQCREKKEKILSIEVFILKIYKLLLQLSFEVFMPETLELSLQSHLWIYLLIVYY